MIEQERARGNISTEEAQRRADALAANIRARQEQILAQERHTEEVANEQRRKYLY